LDNVAVYVTDEELPPLDTPAPTPSATATPEIPVGRVIVTDSIDTFEDLSGGDDLDAPDDRELTIRWNFPESENATQYHVYVKVDGEQKSQFLSRTHDSSETVLRWRADKHFTARKFKDGPQSAYSYQFLVYMLRNNKGNRVSGPIESEGSVRFIVGLEQTPTPLPTATPTVTPTPIPQ